MACHMINYDLKKPGRDYSELIKTIKEYPSWAHPLQSCWLVVTETSSVDIRDNLRRHLDGNDWILVVRVTDWASIGLDDAVIKWLKEYG